MDRSRIHTLVLPIASNISPMKARDRRVEERGGMRLAPPRYNWIMEHHANLARS